MTSHYAVLGNPVAHSLSPDIHAFFAKNTHEDLEYGRVLVPKGEFAKTADAFFEHCDGCNITVPCKGDAFKYADELTPWAQAAGAVNTLKKLDGGKILGDNTDGRGLAADLKRLGIKVAGARLLIIGAGGAARGILKPLAEEKPAVITIANRTFEKAQDLAAAFPGIAAAARLGEARGPFDLIINASSSSLKGVLPAVDESVYQGCGCAYDLMYRPDGHTLFSDHAKEAGAARAYDGFGMLIMQAALSFALWRGIMPDAELACRHFR